MTRKELDRLQRRMEAIGRQHVAGVAIIAPDEAGGYILTCSASSGKQGGAWNRQTHHATIAEAEAAYNLFLQAHPPAPQEDPPLILIDI